MKLRFTIIFIVFLLTSFSINAQSNLEKINFSEDVYIVKLTDHSYLHISTQEIPPYGKVAANGLIYIKNGEVFLIDTPFTEEQTKILVKGITDSLNAKVIACIPTHWHGDCLGGLDYLHNIGVNSYAYQGTIDITKEKGLPIPNHGFKDSLTINFHNTAIQCYFLGGGHATDNIVVWLPSEEILFGGCLVKDMTSTNLGNLSDADIAAWPYTIDKVMKKFPTAKIIIPGHGDIGGKELLEHTKTLLDK